MQIYRLTMLTMVMAVSGLSLASRVAAESGAAISVEQNEAILHQVFSLLNERKLACANSNALCQLRLLQPVCCTNYAKRFCEVCIHIKF